MTLPDEILTPAEAAALRLRGLFNAHGFARFEMSKFEAYELYAANRAFLASNDIIAFTGAGGKLMALRPDVTLSIVKNLKRVPDGISRLYYHENVYRRSGLGREFKERAQVGLECVGEIGVPEMSEVVALAAQSLETLGVRGCLDISHMGFLAALLDALSVDDETREILLRRIAEKNVAEVTRAAERAGANASALEKLIRLTGLYGKFRDVFPELQKLSVGERTDAAARELDALVTEVELRCPGADIRLDFSLVNDMRYYNGVIFQGYAQSVPTALLSGGRYDALLRQFGKQGGAIGFAVYVDLLGREEWK
ncbi:MAG: ATP phosphoribosyltransferase regulatory subunit [Oscillospiraceae bacterium]|jgi:ATP phosphoribosyltransferase regulatory subunit|nr:ATP phosphoribosyltransferase regulatory subunit [Oscillospiraceae bacterium]